MVAAKRPKNNSADSRFSQDLIFDQNGGSAPIGRLNCSSRYRSIQNFLRFLQVNLVAKYLNTSPTAKFTPNQMMPSPRMTSCANCGLPINQLFLLLISPMHKLQTPFASLAGLPNGGHLGSQLVTCWTFYSSVSAISQTTIFAKKRYTICIKTLQFFGIFPQRLGFVLPPLPIRPLPLLPPLFQIHALLRSRVRGKLE